MRSRRPRRTPVGQCVDRTQGHSGTGNDSHLDKQRSGSTLLGGGDCRACRVGSGTTLSFCSLGGSSTFWGLLGYGVFILILVSWSWLCAGRVRQRRLMGRLGIGLVL